MWSNPGNLDSDNDGVMDGLDTCRFVPDPIKVDGEDDGAGDLRDDCPGVADAGQTDMRS